MSRRVCGTSKRREGEAEAARGDTHTKSKRKVRGEDTRGTDLLGLFLERERGVERDDGGLLERLLRAAQRVLVAVAQVARLEKPHALLAPFGLLRSDAHSAARLLLDLLLERRQGLALLLNVAEVRFDLAVRRELGHVVKVAALALKLLDLLLRAREEALSVRDE